MQAQVQRYEAQRIFNVPIELVEVPAGFPNRDQCGDVEGLMKSMERHGLLQPIVLRKKSGKYGFELVAGYRRLLAAKRVGWQNIPGIVLENVNDESLLTLRLIENLNRKDLEIYEVVTLLQQLHGQYGLSYSELAVHSCLSKTTIATFYKLTELPEDVLRQVVDGTGLSYARDILTIKKAYILASSDLTEEEVRFFVRRITQSGLTSKQLSNILQHRAKVQAGAGESASVWDNVKARIRSLERYCKLQGFNAGLDESENCVTLKVCVHKRPSEVTL